MQFSIIAPIGYGIANALSKITGQKVGTQKSVILQTFFASCFLILFGYFFLGFGAVDYKWYLITFLMAIYGYFPLLFFIKAITKGKAGVIIPIVDLAVVVSLFCAYIFTGQTISPIGLLFVAVILIGVTLLSLDIKDLKNSKVFDLESGILFAIIAALMWGVGFFIWSYPVSHIGALPTSLLIEFGGLCTALFHLHFIQKDTVTDLPKSMLKVGLLIGFFGSLGTLGVNLGIQHVGGAITFALLGARPAVSALVGYFVFKEKLDYKQVACLLIIMAGVVGVSLYK